MSLQNHAKACLLRISACTVLFVAGWFISACGGASFSSQPSILAIIPQGAAVPLGQTVQFRATGYMSNGQTEDLTSSVSWQSSNTGIATIGQNGLATPVATGTINMTAHWNGLSATSALVVSKALLESLTITPPSASIVLGQNAQLTAIGTFSDKTTQDLTTAVTWGSAQPDIATVTAGGLATSKGVGNTTVTAALGSVKASNQIVVSPATLVSLSVQSSSATIPLGSNAQFTATGTYTDGSTADLTNTATWASQPAGIVIVSAAGLGAAKTVGSAIVTATSAGISGSSKLTVSSASLVSIAVHSPGTAVPLGTKAQLGATGTYTDGSTADITNTATWTSSPAGILNIGASGAATTTAVGSATVTATSGGKSGSGVFTVSPAALVSIQVSSARSSLPLGSTQQLNATGVYTDSSTQNLTSSVQWTSAAPNVLDVSNVGLATAMAQGSTNVLAASSGITGATGLSVSAAELTSIGISPASPTIALGSTLQFSALGSFTDGTSQDLTSQITWSVDNPDIASISAGGLIAGLQIGSATITASLNGITSSTRITIQPIAVVGYFDATSGIDTTLRITNPDITGQDLCAMIYVFDNDQQMSECCGCIVSKNGLDTLSLNQNLLNNPLTGVQSKVGTVMVVPADYASNLSCNASSMTPAGAQIAWSTHLQKLNTGQTVSTEDTFSPTALNSILSSSLQAQCAFIQTLGSGQGICSCGYGN